MAFEIDDRVVVVKQHSESQHEIGTVVEARTDMRFADRPILYLVQFEGEHRTKNYGQYHAADLTSLESVLA